MQSAGAVRRVVNQIYNRGGQAYVAREHFDEELFGRVNPNRVQISFRSHHASPPIASRTRQSNCAAINGEMLFPIIRKLCHFVR